MYETQVFCCGYQKAVWFWKIAVLMRGHDAKFYVHFCFFKSALLAYCELGAIHTLSFMSYILTKLTAQCLWTLILFSVVDSVDATISNILYTAPWRSAAVEI